MKYTFQNGGLLEVVVVSSVCSIVGCDKPRYQGRYLMCCMHYKRKLRHGDPHHVLRIFGNDVERFWSYVNKTDTCWIWTGPKTRTYDGRPNPRYYGYFEIAGKNVKAHRYSYELSIGPIPDELCLDHVAERCDNTLCVNPQHLEPVTVAENNRRYHANKRLNNAP